MFADGIFVYTHEHTQIRVLILRVGYTLRRIRSSRYMYSAKYKQLVKFRRYQLYTTFNYAYQALSQLEDPAPETKLW